MKLLSDWIKLLLHYSEISGQFGFRHCDKKLLQYLHRAKAIEYTDQSKERLKKDRKMNKIGLRFVRNDERYRQVYNYLTDLMHQNLAPNEPMSVVCSGKKFEFYTKNGDFYSVVRCLAGGVFFYHIKKHGFLGKESDGCMVMEEELKADLTKCYAGSSIALRKKVASRCLSFFKKYGKQNPELAKRIEIGSKKRNHFLDGLQTFKKGKRKYSVNDIKKLLA